MELENGEIRQGLEENRTLCQDDEKLEGQKIRRYTVCITLYNYLRENIACSVFGRVLGPRCYSNGALKCKGQSGYSIIVLKPWPVFVAP